MHTCGHYHRRTEAALEQQQANRTWFIQACLVWYTSDKFSPILLPKGTCPESITTVPLPSDLRLPLPLLGHSPLQVRKKASLFTEDSHVNTRHLLPCRCTSCTPEDDGGCFRKQGHRMAPLDSRDPMCRHCSAPCCGPILWLHVAVWHSSLIRGTCWRMTIAPSTSLHLGQRSMGRSVRTSLPHERGRPLREMGPEGLPLSYSIATLRPCTLLGRS